MGRLKEVGKRLLTLFNIIIPSISFTVIFITFLIAIGSRYIFKHPVTWTYELSILGYMWTMFFCVGISIKTDEHVVFGLVYDKLNDRWKMITRVAYNVILVALLIACLVPCTNAMLRNSMVTGVLQMPFKIVFAPFIYMLVEIIIRSILNIVQVIKEYRGISEVKQ